MQDKTVSVTREVGSQIKPGQSEKEIADLYYAKLEEAGLFYENLVKDSLDIVNKTYGYTTKEAKTIQDIYNFAIRLINEDGFSSLDPMGDVGHSIFQVPAGQTVDKTPQEDRLFIYPDHGNRPIEGIISIEPQLSNCTLRPGQFHKKDIRARTV